MGPRLVSRGKRRYACGRQRWRTTLQWGRDLLVAERWIFSRREGCPDGTSMGPRLVSRGKGDRPVDRRSGRRTSMGPRLVSRGKTTIAPVAEERLLLQWGRDLLVAERRSLRGRHASRQRLQWGRDLLVAESEDLAAELDRRGVASMGPRLVSRGKPPTT